MEEKKLLEYIQRISETLGRFRTFDIYDEDDITQEIYFLLLKAESVYDPNKGDEYTFYFNYVSNRLKILKRDRYKKHFMGQNFLEDGQDFESIFDCNLSEYIEEIDKRILPQYRADYLRFKEGAKLPHRNKHIIIGQIKEILGRILKDGD